MNENNNELVYTSDDIEENKLMAGLAYIIFFLPLLAAPNSKFARFHANQGLLLFILSVGGNLVLNFIPFIGGMLNFIFSIFVFVLAIMGFVNAFGGKVEELPIIGNLRIL